jgi:predicted N-acetyltransferase YhbS
LGSAKIHPWRNARFERRMPRRMPPADLPLRVEYVREPDVSERLDHELRELISGCFPQPRTAFFRERRYALEMPRHRYLMRDPAGRLVGHLAVHEKVVGVGQTDLTIGGMAEMCVHESQRGRGRAKELLALAHRGLQAGGIDFAFLFGEPELYTSSGYRALDATIRRFNPAEQAFETGPMRVALYKPLTDRAWPVGPIDLCGPMF